MRPWPGTDRRSALALALLRATLAGVIFVSEELVDARQLADSGFLPVLWLGAAYAVVGIVIALGGFRSAAARVLERLQPTVDVLLLAGLAYTSGGAYSDVRKAFFVIPLAAAFSERPRSTASWSCVAVGAFTLQAVIAGGHPGHAQNSWERLTLNQDLYLAWTGAAATMLALMLRRRTAHTEELAQSRQRLITQAIDALERERARLAGALHDSPVQNLIAARHDLRRAQRSGDPESFARLHEAIDVTVAQLREEIFNLHPHVLDHVGLNAALEQVARRHAGDAAVEVSVEVAAEVDDVQRGVLFALGRELLGNAAKHAQASRIRLRLTREADALRLEVADDGCGIPDGRMRQALLEGHIGLAAVRERVAALAGTITITTSPGGGTCVMLMLPIEAAPLSPAGGPAVADRVTPVDTLRVSTA